MAKKKRYRIAVTAYAEFEVEASSRKLATMIAQSTMWDRAKAEDRVSLRIEEVYRKPHTSDPDT